MRLLSKTVSLIMFRLLWVDYVVGDRGDDVRLVPVALHLQRQHLAEQGEEGARVFLGLHGQVIGEVAITGPRSGLQNGLLEPDGRLVRRAFLAATILRALDPLVEISSRYFPASLAATPSLSPTPDHNRD